MLDLEQYRDTFKPSVIKALYEDLENEGEEFVLDLIEDIITNPMYLLK
jgi:hypothetical protein